ncbi:hypothetical protein AVEN_143876-1 [Araneus ventricosus]|uniref:TGF-beta family profile domain-containing protein n=1 Tax=Araneus ventricosus TaxID=182803 RepID=A0A4Y2JAG8_ARAVE|nr:hypothetical protein AVEN_143876-1 [Araneus ventricosus]
MAALTDIWSAIEVRILTRFLPLKKTSQAEINRQLEEVSERVHIGVDHEVHLQWIPSHVDIYGNEVADDLAKQGTAEPLCSAPSLTFDENYSIRKNKDLKTWRVPPSHDWYKLSSPGGSIGLACDRADQTALSRFVSGHLRSCSFSHGNKVFRVCAKCGVASASPEHILSCLRLSRETFETDPLLALDFLRILNNELPDYPSEKVDGSLAEVQARLKYKPLDSAVAPRSEARKVSKTDMEKHRKRRRRRRRKDKRLPYAWGKSWWKKSDMKNNPDYEGDEEEDEEEMDDQLLCQKRKMVVSFSEIGWGDWIISPKTFDASYCSGVCPQPLKKVSR